jgi:hypothetical protein
MVRYTSTYALDISIWNHVSVIQNSSKGIMYFVINNKIEGTGVLVSPPMNPSADIIIGYNPVRNEYLNGVIDQLEVYDIPISQDKINTIYDKSLSNQLLIKHNFANYNSITRMVFDSGMSASHGVLVNASQIESENFVRHDIWTHVVDKTAFNATHTKHIKIQTSVDHIAQGKCLDKTTFMAWVKPMSRYGYNPIISKDGVFCFSINGGVPELLLGNGTTFYPLPKRSIMNMLDVKYGFDYTGSTYTFAGGKETEDESLKEGSGIPIKVSYPVVGLGRSEGHIGLKTDITSSISVSGADLRNINMDSFTFGAWVKSTDTIIQKNQPIFTKEGVYPVSFYINTDGNLSLNFTIADN